MRLEEAREEHSSALPLSFDFSSLVWARNGPIERAHLAKTGGIAERARLGKTEEIVERACLGKTGGIAERTCPDNIKGIVNHITKIM